MNKKLTHCPECDKKFENEDEIVKTTASGNQVIVHADCLDDWLNRWGTREYFGKYSDLLNEIWG